jgi:hypothetical protein
MPGWYCYAADESIHTGEDMKVSDRALNRLKAATEGLPLPEEIKRIRVKLGLTQEAAGELIGGGPRAFQKCEAGDLLAEPRDRQRPRSPRSRPSRAFCPSCAPPRRRDRTFPWRFSRGGLSEGAGPWPRHAGCRRQR